MIDIEKLREASTEKVAEALDGAYYCTRVWEAWSYGTMGPEDFSLVVEDSDYLAEIVDAALAQAVEAIETQAIELKEAQLNALGRGNALHKLQKRARAMDAEIARLREALTPFAEFNSAVPEEAYPENLPVMHGTYPIDGEADRVVMLFPANFQAAADALVHGESQ